jgi:hypothetical protein
MKPPLPPLEEIPWELPPLAREDVDPPPAPARGWAKKVWRSLTGATSAGNNCA